MEWLILIALVLIYGTIGTVQLCCSSNKLVAAKFDRGCQAVFNSSVNTFAILLKLAYAIAGLLKKFGQWLWGKELATTTGRRFDPEALVSYINKTPGVADIMAIGTCEYEDVTNAVALVQQKDGPNYFMVRIGESHALAPKSVEVVNPQVKECLSFIEQIKGEKNSPRIVVHCQQGRLPYAEVAVKRQGGVQQLILKISYKNKKLSLKWEMGNPLSLVK